jgi:hypothetical protein
LFVTFCLSNDFYFVDDADAEAEEVLNDLNRLVEGEDANMNLNDSQRQQEGDWNQHGKISLPRDNYATHSLPLFRL